MTSCLRSLHPFDPDPGHPTWCSVCGRTEDTHITDTNEQASQ